MVSILQALKKQRLCRLLLGAFICLLMVPGSAALAQKKSDAPSEYEIKALLLGKLFRYIEFPENAPKEGPFTIVVVGKEPREEYLEEVEKLVVNGRIVRVIRMRKFKKEDADFQNCHIVFIHREARRHTEDILESVPEHALTISEYTGFIEDDGGMINFVIIKSRLKMQFNQQNTSEAGIRIPSDLLRRSPKVIRKRTSQG